MSYPFIFASDFDGTIYFNDQEVKISPDIIPEVEELRAHGGLFGFCSGRGAGMIEGFAPGPPKPDFIIGSSGAMIVDGDHQVIYEQHLSLEIADSLIQAGLAKSYPCSVQTSTGMYILGERPDFLKFIKKIDSIYDITDELIHDVSMKTASPEEAAVMTSYLNETFGDSVTAFQNVESIDIVPKGCSKGNGLKKVKELLQADYTYGIGDSMNDIPLLEAADTSFTFHTSPEEVQKKASILVDTVEEAIRHAYSFSRR